MNVPAQVLAQANPQALATIASMQARAAHYQASGPAAGALTVLPSRPPKAPPPLSVAATASSHEARPSRNPWAPVVDAVNARRAVQDKASASAKAKMLAIAKPSGSSSWTAAVEEANQRRGFGNTQAEASEYAKARMRQITASRG